MSDLKLLLRGVDHSLSIVAPGWDWDWSQCGAKFAINAPPEKPAREFVKMVKSLLGIFDLNLWLMVEVKIQHIRSSVCFWYSEDNHEAMLDRHRTRPVR